MGRRHVSGSGWSGSHERGDAVTACRVVPATRPSGPARSCSALACVIAQPQVRSTPLEDQPTHGLLLNSGKSTRLIDTVPAIALRARLFFRVDEIPESVRRERYRVRITAYNYALVGASTGSELLAFHWHPESAEGGLHVVTFPHLHIDSSVLSEQALSKMHIPTGRMAIEDILRPVRFVAPL